MVIFDVLGGRIPMRATQATRLDKQPWFVWPGPHRRKPVLAGSHRLTLVVNACGPGHTTDTRGWQNRPETVSRLPGHKIDTFPRDFNGKTMGFRSPALLLLLILDYYCHLCDDAAVEDGVSYHLRQMIEQSTSECTVSWSSVRRGMSNQAMMEWDWKGLAEALLNVGET